MTIGIGKTKREMNVLAISKGKECYIFLYDGQSHRSLIRQLFRFAANKELSFTWSDASELCKAARRLKEGK
jgi:hypothetical protein